MKSDLPSYANAMRMPPPPLRGLQLGAVPPSPRAAVATTPAIRNTATPRSGVGLGAALLVDTVLLFVPLAAWAYGHSFVCRISDGTSLREVAMAGGVAAGALFFGGMVSVLTRYFRDVYGAALLLAFAAAAGGAAGSGVGYVHGTCIASLDTVEVAPAADDPWKALIRPD